MDVPENSVTALIGPSGCGKSTFIRTVNRMNDLIPTFSHDGNISLDGVDVYDDAVDVVDLRKKVGMVFQKPNPFPKSIFDNVAYGLRIHGEEDEDYIAQVVEESLKSAAIWDEVKDKLDRHYGNVNYSFPTANGASVTLDAMGYNTKWKVGAATTDPRSATEELTNSIWGVSASYNRDAHNLMLAYQDNAGNIGYDYAYNAGGLQSIYVPNSYLSDFNGNDEKSVGLQYNYNFKNHGFV